MATRFPLAGAPGDAETQKSIRGKLERVHAHGGGFRFPWMSEDGSSLVSYFAPLTYCPEMVEPIFKVAGVVNNPVMIKPRNRELVIMAVVSVTRVPLIDNCHRQLAAAVGFSDEQYDQGISGQSPSGLSEEEVAVYELSRQLTVLNEPMDEASWAKARIKLEKSDIVMIAHVVSTYRWIGLLDMVNADSTWSR